MQERASSLRHVRSSSLSAGLLVLGFALAAQGEAKKPPATAGQASFAQTGASELLGEVLVQGERGSLLSVDDRPVGVLPLPTSLWLSPGLHKISTSLGTKRQEEQYKVLAARTAELRFNLSSDVVVATLQPAVLLLIVPTGTDGPNGQAALLHSEEIVAIEQAVTQVARAKQLGLQSQAAALVTAPELAACLTEKRCQLSLAEQNQTTMLLILSVTVQDRWRTGRELGLQLAAYDTGVAEQAAVQQRICSTCVPTRAGELTQELADKVLTEAVGRPRGTLVVRSQPEGADVWMNGKVYGQTPLKQPVWAGTYSLVVRKAGFAELSREVIVGPGQKQTVEATLLPETEVRTARKVTLTEGEPLQAGQRPRWRIVAGASAVVVGAVVLGFGISALAVNSRCVAGLGDPTVQCPQVYDTVTPGAALTSVGGAALLTGTMLLAWPPTATK